MFPLLNLPISFFLMMKMKLSISESGTASRNLTLVLHVEDLARYLKTTDTIGPHYINQSFPISNIKYRGNGPPHHTAGRMRVSHDSLLVFRLIFREAVHSLYHRIVQSAEHCTRLSENRGCEDGGSIPSPCGNTLTLIYHIMKDSFKKIQSLADELAKNADVTNGGGHNHIGLQSELRRGRK